MGWLGFLVVLIVCAIMLLLSGIKLIINVLGSVSFLGILFGTVLFIAHKIIKRKNGVDSIVTMIPVVIFWIMGIVILVAYCGLCIKNGNDIDLIDFFFKGMSKSIW